MSAGISYDAPDAALFSDDNLSEEWLDELFGVAAGSAPFPNESQPASPAVESSFPFTLSTPNETHVAAETAPISDENLSEELFSSEGLLEELFGPEAGSAPFPNESLAASPVIETFFPFTLSTPNETHVAAETAPISDENLSEGLLEELFGPAAGSAPFPNESLAASPVAGSSFPFKPSTPNETLAAMAAVESWFPITSNAGPITDWSLPFSPTTKDLSEMTVDHTPNPNHIAPMDFDTSLDQIAANSTPILNHSEPLNFATSPSQIAAGTYLQDSTPNHHHIAPMNFATSRSQMTADSTPAPNHISPMNFATNRSQVTADSTPTSNHISLMNSATSASQISADSTPTSNHISPMNSATSVSQITADSTPTPNHRSSMNSAMSVSQIAADSTPTSNQVPPMNFATSGANIVYYIGVLVLNEQQFHEYVLALPVGPELLEIQKLYIRGKKHFCYEIKADIDMMKDLGLYQEAEASLRSVLERAEANLLQWGMSEDTLNNDPRAKSLAKIARKWGAYVGDYFRRSSEREHSLRAVASAANSVPNYILARRLVNENILARLEKVTGSQYRRKRYATIPDWYGIRGMAPIHEPIDSSRLFTLGLHFGEFDVLEEGIV